MGAAYEFKSPGSFNKVTEMIGGGPFNLDAGEWTDDTSMALCLAESLVQSRGFDPQDQMQRYARWYREGYMSVKGRCFDIGNTTRRSIEAYEKTGITYSDSSNPGTAGNGSLMRLAPVPMAYSMHPKKAVEYCVKSSRITHSSIEAVDSCGYFGGLIVGAINGVDKDALLSARWSPLGSSWPRNAFCEAVDEIAEGSFKVREPPVIQGSGYVIRCLEAALWAFYHSHDFREGCLLAVNLGDDTDTTAAVYGQIAGAYYGVESIPVGWLEKLAWWEKITDYSRALYQLSKISDIY
jgi:ADP-ribosyl-[dinitrogen reductase] hydrolase